MGAQRSGVLACLVVAISFGFACSKASTGVTFYKDVKPIVDAKCANCHVAGGIAPFSLTSANNAVLYKELIKADVTSRKMPPWPPDNACAQYSNNRALTDAQIQTIVSWVDSGARLGTPSDAPKEAAAPGGLSRVDFAMQMPKAYTPQLSPDDYRCFVLDWPQTSPTYVTGFGIRPGESRIVHHVVAYIISPELASEYTQMDGVDGLPGFPCFGGPGGNKGIPSLLGVWAPGSSGLDFPSGTGILMAPGSKVVLQVHYNTLVTKPVPDQTSIAVEVASSVQKQAVIMPFVNPSWMLNRTMDIPAGNPDVVHSFVVDPTDFLGAFSNGAFEDGLQFTIYVAGLHMHRLGTHVHTWIQRASGEEQCLLDIPHWDFDWQGAYEFSQPITFNSGDQLGLECHWDNSAAHQPVVNGMQAAPQDVNWGEGSTDEMCMGFYYIAQ